MAPETDVLEWHNFETALNDILGPADHELRLAKLAYFNGVFALLRVMRARDTPAEWTQAMESVVAEVDAVLGALEKTP